MKYPKGEIVWESYYSSNKEMRFIITSKAARDYYFLYEVVNGEFKKLGKAKRPPELEERFNVIEKMSVQNV